MDKIQKEKLENAKTLLQDIIDEKEGIIALFDVIEKFHMILRDKYNKESIIKNRERIEIVIKPSMRAPFLESLTQIQKANKQEKIYLEQLIRNIGINTPNKISKISHMLVMPVSSPKETPLNEILNQIQKLNKNRKSHCANLYNIWAPNNSMNKKDKNTLSTEEEMNVNE